MKRIVGGLCFAFLAFPAFAEHRDGPFQGFASNRGTATGGASATTVPSPDPVWGKDHNFIAPAP